MEEKTTISIKEFEQETANTMNFLLPRYFYIFQQIFVFILLTGLTGCGAVGSPIPPEDVGIAAKVRKQKRDTAPPESTLREDGTTAVEEEIVELPAFYPIGTR